MYMVRQHKDKFEMRLRERKRNNSHSVGDIRGVNLRHVGET